MRVRLFVASLALLLAAGCSNPGEQGLEELERYQDSAWFAPSTLAQLPDPAGSSTRGRERGTSSYLFEFPPPVPTKHHEYHLFEDHDTARGTIDELVAELMSHGAIGCALAQQDAYSVWLAALPAEGDEALMYLTIRQADTQARLDYSVALNNDSGWSTKREPSVDCVPLG